MCNRGSIHWTPFLYTNPINGKGNSFYKFLLELIVLEFDSVTPPYSKIAQQDPQKHGSPEVIIIEGVLLRCLFEN